MTVSVTDQALFFAGALVMGAAVGLLYDAFRILRVRVRLPLLGGVLDLLFWLVVTVALFVYTTTAGSGEVRLYIVAAVLLGAAAYFWLLSRWFLKLGQPSTTLSGGESQRIKLATELSKRDTGQTIYILDEPTTGLHFEDIRVLLGVLNRLVDKGNTVMVIEHNLDVIKSADFLIDMGPDGGRGGGELLFEGTPEDLVRYGKGYTAAYLKEVLYGKAKD